MFEVLASSAVSAVWVWLGSCVDDWHFTERTAQWKLRNSKNAMPFVSGDDRSISYRTDLLAKGLGSLSNVQGISLGKRFSGCLSDVVAVLSPEEVGDWTHNYGCPLRNQNVSGSSKI